MGFFEKFSFDENKLIAFYLGGRTEKCNLELHDVIFLVGKNSDELIPQIKEKWFGTLKSLHVDSWYAVENVQGFDIHLVKEEAPSESTNSLKLYFVNLGYYQKGVFGEKHHIELIVAESIQDAKNQAKKRLESNTQEPHTDDIYEIDDCLEIEKVGGYRIVLKPGDKVNQDPVNGWQRVI